MAAKQGNPIPMSLQHFFLEHQVIADEQDEVFALRLTAEDLKHAGVLRMKRGEHIAVIDGAGDYFECEIASLDRDGMSVRITQKGDAATQQATVILAQGIAKGDKMDAIVRQGTEIGVSGFIPFAAARSVVRLDDAKAERRMGRWRQIAKSAAMQSGRRSIPEIASPMVLGSLCEFAAQAHAVLVCWEEEAAGDICAALRDRLGMQGVIPDDARVIVVIGPEGGLEPEEVAALKDANRYCVSVSLGTTVLRTETAGVVASALVIHELGGLQ